MQQQQYFSSSPGRVPGTVPRGSRDKDEDIMLYLLRRELRGSHRLHVVTDARHGPIVYLQRDAAAAATTTHCPSLSQSP